MNKRTKKRAVLVYIAVCLFYGTVAFKVPDKLTMRRSSLPPSNTAQDMSIYGGPLQPASYTPREPEPLTRPEKTVALPPKEVSNKGVVPMSPEQRIQPAADGSGVEPSFLISVPLICHAIDAGWIEREGLIAAKREGDNKGTWKRPTDIIRDRDDEGIRSILRAIEKNHVTEFLKREGLEPRDGLTVDDLVAGKGYRMEKKKLVSLYDRYVSDRYKDLFPLYFLKAGIKKGKDGFEFFTAQDSPGTTVAGEEREWMMPNLSGLPIRVAIEKLSKYTTRIRVYGGGTVAEQTPRSFERLKGEAECLIQGRAGRD